MAARICAGVDMFMFMKFRMDPNNNYGLMHASYCFRIGINTFNGIE